jgi:VWFA-related protein
VILHGWRHLLRAAAPIAVLSVLAAAAACASAGGERPPSGPTAVEPPSPPVTLDAPPSLVVEAIVTDKKGVPVEDLRVRDFQVSVDGRRRFGLALARLYRGPGAELLAQSRPATTSGEVAPLAEASRLMVIVVDQASLAPRDEVRARALAAAWLNLTGLSDRVAVVTLPARSETTTVSYERADLEKTIAGIRALRMADTAALASDSEAERGVAMAGATASADESRRMGSAATEPAKGDPNVEPRGVARDRADLRPDVTTLDEQHAVTMLTGLRQVLSALRRVPGAKTVLLLSAGLVATSAAAEARAVTLEAARAQARIFVLQVPTMSAFGEAGARDLHLLAQETGGLVVPPTGKPDAALQGLAGQLAFSYLLLLAPMPGDNEAAPHELQVTLPGRANLMVQVPKLLAPGRVSTADLATALSPRATPPPRPFLTPGPTRGERSAIPQFKHDAALDRVLARVSQYVWDYGQALSSVVAEETYTQEVRGEPAARITLNGKSVGGGSKSVTLTSDYLLVQVPGIDGWVPFRDVFAVNGQPVSGREDRLVKLFLAPASSSVALERANAISLESARYNIGSVRRNINAPLLPLWFLEPRSLRRFAFRKAGEETLAGSRLVVIEFNEVAHPTFIKTPEGADLPARGRIWIDQLNGRIHRTVLMVSMATITVNYGPRDEVPGLWLPVTMDERYENQGVTITGKASYSKFRRFQVTTTEQVTLPKK